MKFIRGFLVWAIIGCFALHSAAAQAATVDVVYLKNGGVIRGSIVELTPGGTVRIRTADGSLVVYPMTDVDHVANTADSPTRNPYTFHKDIAAWGLGLSYVATVITAAAMDDDYIGTTAIPVAGPWITMARIEGNSGARYLPGGKPLLAVSGLAQSGFLIYMLVAWGHERSYASRVAVVPAQRGHGLAVSYSF